MQTNELGEGFGEWLVKQIKRDDWVGTLAKSAKGDAPVAEEKRPVGSVVHPCRTGPGDIGDRPARERCAVRRNRQALEQAVQIDDAIQPCSVDVREQLAPSVKQKDSLRSGNLKFMSPSIIRRAVQ